MTTDTEDAMDNTPCRGSNAGKPKREMGLIGLRVFLPLILSATLTAAPPAPLPRAESILDAWVEKSGGRAVFDPIANRRTQATMTLSVMPGSAEVTTFVTKAGPYRCVVHSPAFGLIEFGSDGQTVWEITPMSGPQVKTGIERQRFQSLYSLDLPMRWRDAFRKVECAGRANIEGKPALQVKAVTPGGYVITYYFDQASGLLVKIALPMETATGPSLQEIDLRDYRRVAGTLFPFVQIRREPGREMTLTFTRVDYDVTIPEGTLALPGVIQRILQAGN